MQMIGLEKYKQLFWEKFSNEYDKEKSFWQKFLNGFAKPSFSYSAN